MPQFWCKQMASESELLPSTFYYFLKTFFPQIVAKFDSKWKQVDGLGSLYKTLLIVSDNSPLANLCKQEPCLLSGVI